MLRYCASVGRVAARFAALAAGVVTLELAVLGTTTPRLPKAPGKTHGRKEPEVSAKEGPRLRQQPLRLLVFGDSVACGCGCPSNELAFAGACAEALVSRTGRAVDYDVLGVIGYTAADMAAHLIPKIDTDVSYDVVMISCGVNHVLSLHSRAQYEAQLTELLKKLRLAVGPSCVILLGAMPPMAQFPQISYLQPLNVMVGLLASNIGEASKAVCKEISTTLAPLAHVEWKFDELLDLKRAQIERLMAPDGFHPGYDACMYMAGPMADSFVALTRPDASSIFDSFAPESRQERGIYAVKHTLCPDGCLPLWVADMELGTAPSIQDAIRARTNHPTFGYTIQPDIIWRRVARWLMQRHGWSGLRPDDFIFTPNLVSSTVNGLRAFTRQEDAVCMLLPLYRPLQDLVEKEGRKLVTLDLCLRCGATPRRDGTSGYYYTVDFDALRKCFAEESIKLLIFCSPQNPSGRVWSVEELTRVVTLAREFGVKIISDEIHSDLVLPSSGRKHTPLALVARDLGYEKNVMTMSGPGKTWNVAGMHCGFVVMENPDMRKRYMEVAGHAYLSFGSAFATTTMLAAYATATEVQEAHAGIGTSRGSGDQLSQNLFPDPAAWLEHLLKYLDRNIDVLEQFVAKRLPRIRVMRPEASFLVWLDCREMSVDGVPADLASFFTDKARVFLSPGASFGGDKSSGFMRMNVACPTSFLIEALKKVECSYNDMFPPARMKAGES